VLKALANAPTAMLWTPSRWGNMDAAIRPVAAGMQCFGPAFTLRCWPADNLTIHRAVELAAHGDVLVIDGGSGRDTRFGEPVYAAHLRLGGIVLQGLRGLGGGRRPGLPVQQRDGARPGGDTASEERSRVGACSCGPATS
jgi:4-hydroxy-4-methyl-2-oxoglutarate aldolase